MKINNNSPIHRLISNYSAQKNDKALLKEKSENDQLKLSDESKSLHRLASKSNEILQSIEDVRKEDLELIKSKVKDGYYQTDEIISNVAAGFLEDEELQKLFLNEEIKEVVEEYIDIRESNIDKVEKSKNTMITGGYQKGEVYEKVADDIIDIYT